MWSIIKPLLYLNKSNISPITIKKLLDTDDEITIVNTESNISPILKKLKATNIKDEEYIDFEKIETFIKHFDTIINEIFEDDYDNKFTAMDEWILFVTRMTLLNDDWYNNNRITKNRCSFTQEIYTLFVLEMALRLKRRWKLIMIEPEEGEILPPIWCNYTDFIGGKDWFVVHTDSVVDEIIRNWKPKKYILHYKVYF